MNFGNYISSCDLGYIAGMIDGEGHISFSKSPGQYAGIQVGISNTNEEIIKKCMDIMARIGCNPKLYVRKIASEKWKQCYSVLVTNQKDCLLFLTTILDCLSGKKARAQLMIDFIASRSGKKNRKLTTAEEMMLSGIRTLNKRGALNAI